MNTGHPSGRPLPASGAPVDPVEPDDPADMGTCFGLEMTLAAAVPGWERGRDASGAVDVDEPWWHRLDRRGPLPA